MLRKLLKYDTRAIGKFWWIAAVASVALAVLGGVCVNVLDVEYTSYTFMPAIATIGMMIVIMGFGAFSLITMILIFVRFYKNFFSDEGYLTFTLPVKRSQLLKSKLISATGFVLLTDLCLGIDFIVMMAVAYPEKVFSIKLYRDIALFIKELFHQFGPYTIIYALEILVGFVLVTVCSILAIYVCITFAAVIARRVKFLVALGFYYAYSMVLSFMFEILIFDGSVFRIINWIGDLGADWGKLAFAVLFLGLVAIAALCCAAFYTLEGYLLRKRLNLD